MRAYRPKTFRPMRGDLPGHPFRGNQYSADQTTADRVLGAVTVLWAHTGRPPTLRELAAALRLDSPSAVLPYLKALEADGRIEREEAAGAGFGRAVWPAGVRDGIRRLCRERVPLVDDE